MSEQRESDYEQIATAIGKLGDLLCIGMIFIVVAISDGLGEEWIGGVGIFIVIAILIAIGREDKERREIRKQNSSQKNA